MKSTVNLGTFLETPAQLITANFLERISHPYSEGDDPYIGQRIGAYRVVREIDRGGMGTVYLAERDDEHFDRKVAIKILRTDRDAKDIISHFVAERQILASLNHKSIAQLIDGGATDDGRPYIVMEYVDGMPIDRYCDSLELPVIERLQLFLQAAEAVEHAHRHLVVHRDFKPSNVLVTIDGKVKLLDFGIAKLLDDGDLGAARVETRPGARLLTPEYAAPEQILGERVRTETDVYALAAVLYELLTGIRPYAGHARGSVLERVIAGGLPTRPSAVVLTESPSDPKGEPKQDRFKARRTGPEALARTLSGDLDAILLQGLMSRPEDRYSSVRELREDIERHLAGYPVTARGDARVYRARRFVWRHWAAVAAATAFLTLLAGSAIGLAVQRAAIVVERDRAEREVETARQLTTFLTEIFQSSDPGEQLGDTVTAGFLLERSTERVRTELADQPEIRAELLETLGSVYTSLGSYDEAREILEDAVQLRRDAPQPDPASLARGLVLLGELLVGERSFELSLDPFREASALLGADEGGKDLTLGRAEEGLGDAFLMLREIDSAEVYLARAAERYRQSEGPPTRSYLGVLIGLAGIARENGDFEESERLYGQVLELDKEGKTLDRRTVAVTLNNLGFLRRTQGDDRGAADYYRRALDLHSSLYGRAHPTSLMMAGNLAWRLQELGDLEGSIEVLRISVEASEEEWPEGHWRLADQYFGFGAELLAAGRFSEAVDQLRLSLTMGVGTLGEGHSWVRIWLGWYAMGLSLASREEEATGQFEQSWSSLAHYDGLREDLQAVSRL
ncbi:MAG: protein kinase, partial [Demequinaceae bacterium]|nr:protein kinase [Demequinaceae bacterium]